MDGPPGRGGRPAEEIVAANRAIFQTWFSGRLPWTDAQVRLAFDLLGAPAAFREGRPPGVELDESGRVLDPADDQAAVARRQVEALQRLRDEVERHLAESDLSHDADAECRRLRRYETKLRREIRWSIAQLQSQVFERRTRPDLRPSFDLGLEPEPEFASDSAPEPALKPEPKSADEIAAEGWTPEMISPPLRPRARRVPRTRPVPRHPQDRRQSPREEAEEGRVPARLEASEGRAPPSL